MKLFPVVIATITLFVAVSSERIEYSNSTTFYGEHYFVFPWYHNSDDKWWNVRMDHLFYDFEIRNNESNTFIVVVPFVDWNRLCQNNCSLSKNVSYMRDELWGVYVKTLTSSEFNYTLVLDYHFGEPHHKKSYHADLPGWAVAVIVITPTTFFFTLWGIACYMCSRSKKKDRSPEKKPLIV